MDRADVGSLLDHVARTVTTLLPATAASVILWDETEQRFMVSASTLASQPQSYVLGNVRGSGGATRWIVEERRPLAVSDAQEDPFGANRMLVDAGLRAYLGVPLVFRDRAIGVLYALDAEPRRYQPDDVDFMTVLARRAATAIGLARLVEELDRLTRVDDLTGVSNRREFMATLEAEIARRRRTGRPLSVIVLDIDHFKEVNDRYGHDGGDVALATAAGRCAPLLRVNDVFARVGGEEFGVVLPDADVGQAARIAGRLRDVIRAEPIDVTEDAGITLTATLGVAQHEPDEDLASLLRRADRAMYQGKAAGRDCVRVADPADSG